MKNGIAVTLLVFISSAVDLFAQNTSVDNRWVLKSSYSSFALNSGYYSPQVLYMDAKGRLRSRKTGQYLVEANYGVNNTIEMAIYTGVSRLPLYSDDRFETSYAMDGTMLALFYGISINFHILPLVLKESKFPVDFYVGNRFGWSYFSTPPGKSPKSGNYHDFGVYGGLAYYPIEPIGVFGEYGLANGISWNTDGVPRSFRTWFKVGVCVKLQQ